MSRQLTLFQCSSTASQSIIENEEYCDDSNSYDNTELSHDMEQGRLYSSSEASISTYLNIHR